MEPKERLEAMKVLSWLIIGLSVCMTVIVVVDLIVTN